MVARHGAPGDWVISVFDANGLRVARSRAHEANLGGAASPTLRALVAKAGARGIRRDVDARGRANLTRPTAESSRAAGWWPWGFPRPWSKLPATGRWRSMVAASCSRSRSDPSRPCGSPEASRARSTSSAVPPRRSAAARRRSRRTHPFRRFATSPPRSSPPPRSAPASRSTARRSCARNRSARDGGGGRSGEGSVSGGAVARAADSAERGVRLGADASRRADPGRGGCCAGAGSHRTQRQRAGPAGRRPARRLTRHHGKDAARRPQGGPEHRGGGGGRRRSAGRGSQGHPAAERAGSARRPDHGRSRSAPADRVEPAHQRGEIHAEGRPDPGAPAAHQLPRRDRRQRHRTGHRAGRLARHLRAISPGGQLEHANPRRPRSRAWRSSSTSSSFTAAPSWRRAPAPHAARPSSSGCR